MSELVSALYLGGFALATAACLWGAVRVLSFEDGEIRRPLAVFLALTGLWGATSTLLLVARSLAVMNALYILGLVVGLGTVLAWLWFCSAYAGHAYHYDRRLQALTVGGYLAIVAVKLTNPIHHGYYRPAMASDPFVHFAPEVGVVYWTVAALSYVGAAVGLSMLFEMYFSSRFGTRKVAVLTAVLGLPVIPKLLAAVRPDSLLLVFYEPIGAAVFAVGVVTVARDSFLSVRAPARRQLADRLSEVVIVVDDAGRIAEYNDSATRLFPDLAGSVGDPLAAAAPELVGAEANSLLELRPAGTARYYAVTIPPVTLGATTVGRAFVLSDVTELESQRRRLKQQTEHMENLTEAIAHELRNPLTILQGELQLLEEGTGPADVTDGGADRETIASAQGAADRIEAVVDDLISIVRYGTPITETEPLVLADLLDTAWETCDAEGMRFDSPVDGHIVGERVRCLELFRHLFRVHGQRGATTVRASAEGERLLLDSDGEPFSAPDTEQLFQYGAEGGEGMRILLANAWTLANLHGWTVGVEAEDGDLRLVLEGMTRFPEPPPAERS